MSTESVLTGRHSQHDGLSNIDLSAAGMATAGNNRKVHLIRSTFGARFVTMCGNLTPRRPQTTQERLPKCRRCFG